MIDGSEKRNLQLAFELQNLHVCEKRSNNEKKEIRENVYIREIHCISIHFVVILFIKSKDKNHILCTLKGLLYHQSEVKEILFDAE